MGTTRSKGQQASDRASGNGRTGGDYGSRGLFGFDYGSGRSERGYGGGSGRSQVNENLDPFMGYSIKDLGGGKIQIGAPSNFPALGSATINFGEEAAVNYEGSAGLIGMIQARQGTSNILKNIFAKYRTAPITKEEGDRRTFFKEQRELQLKETSGDRFQNALGSSLLTSSKGGIV